MKRIDSRRGWEENRWRQHSRYRWVTPIAVGAITLGLAALAWWGVR